MKMKTFFIRMFFFFCFCFSRLLKLNVCRNCGDCDGKFSASCAYDLCISREISLETGHCDENGMYNIHMDLLKWRNVFKIWIHRSQMTVRFFLAAVASTKYNTERAHTGIYSWLTFCLQQIPVINMNECHFIISSGLNFTLKSFFVSKLEHLTDCRHWSHSRHPLISIEWIFLLNFAWAIIII